MCENRLLVSIIIVVNDGEKVLPELLNDLVNQDFPPQCMELILVDSLSTDSTKNIFNDFIEQNIDHKIKVLTNTKRILATGWNLALSQSIGESLIRIDAHTRLPKDFIRKNIERINLGEVICGGYIKSIIPKKKNALLAFLADSSKFGGSPASFRNPGKSRYVDTIAYACYKREVFGNVGGFDERLVRNQDNDMHYRIRKAGYKFFFDGEIHSEYIPRDSISQLFKQKYLNGYWIGISLGISPFCFNFRHFVPALFLIALILSIQFSYYGQKNLLSSVPITLLLSVYFFSSLCFSVKAIVDNNNVPKISAIFLPIIFFIMHLTYGLGTVVGLFFMPFYVFSNSQYSKKWPIINK
jgi:glycosyltransferase involved in cell wall biosynthesis